MSISQKAVAELGIAYADGVHLDAPSATLCLGLILGSCAAMGLPNR